MRCFLFACRLVPLATIVVVVGTGACDSNGQNVLVHDANTSAPRSDGGAIQVTGTTNNCPTVTLALSPPDANVGVRVALAASVSDADVGSTLTYAWTADTGSFGDARAPQTTYTCASAGPRTLTVAVSDGPCTTTQSVIVYCLALPATAGAPLQSAGTGGISGTGGRSGSAGSVGGTVTGGAGGSAMASPGPNPLACTGDPTMDEGDACNQCTAANCVARTDGCSLELLGSDAKRQKCLSLYCCIRANRCVVAGDPTTCWCGNAPYNACILSVGAANGPCLNEIEDAAETKLPSDIKQRLVDPTYALGGAVNLSQCRGTFCARNPIGVDGSGAAAGNICEL